ncbi:hypothetical protein GC194_05370 [bacterium]|nr:hypothetical protein [bacterium]
MAQNDYSFFFVDKFNYLKGVFNYILYFWIDLTMTNMNLDGQNALEKRVLKTIDDFTKTAPKGSITTGMLYLLLKPELTSQEFKQFLNKMEEKGYIKGMPSTRTMRWKRGDTPLAD